MFLSSSDGAKAVRWWQGTKGRMRQEALAISTEMVSLLQRKPSVSLPQCCRSFLEKLPEGESPSARCLRHFTDCEALQQNIQLQWEVAGFLEAFSRTLDLSAVPFSQWHVQPSCVHSQTDVHTLTHIVMFVNFLPSFMVYEKSFSNLCTFQVKIITVLFSEYRISSFKCTVLKSEKSSLNVLIIIQGQTAVLLIMLQGS